MALLASLSTKAPDGLEKEAVKAETAAILKRLDELQYLLYAEGKHAVLAVIQGLDASGKDGAIRDVFGYLNPQGVTVASFKVPTEEERSHDFLWRIHRHAPARGMIQVFNRSHYEDVLVTRVHGLCDDAMAVKRFAAINAFEQLLQEHNQTTILKFYLHVSAAEQQERLNERMHDPTKAWKYNARDFEEAKRWDDYHRVYEDVFARCNNPAWTIVPADQNWYKEYLIAKTLADALEGLSMQYPPLKP